MTYRASRSKLLEAVKVWKESDLGKHFYRSSEERVDEASIIRAPWLPVVDQRVDESGDEPTSSIRSRWLDEDAESFGDYAEQIDPDTMSEIVSALGGDDAVVEAIRTQLEQNPGAVMILAHEGSNEGYVIGFNEGQLYAAGCEVEEDFLDEGLISMQLLARTAPGVTDAPIIPGFPLIEGQSKMYEVLQSSVVLLNTLRENEKIDPDFVQVIEAFATDLATVIAELSLDENSLSESEINLVFETFAGVFAGLHEESLVLSAE